MGFQGYKVSRLQDSRVISLRFLGRPKLGLGFHRKQVLGYGFQRQVCQMVY
jgi:hypothetical protein